MTSSRQSDTPFFFVGQDTHIGYDRLVNEDAFGWVNTANGEIFIVADGLGGQAGGGVASRLAVSAFHEYISSRAGEPDDLLRGGVLAADAAVAKATLDYPELTGLGSTLVAVLLQKTEAWYIHVGDSRLYLLSAEGLQLLTRDHTRAQELIDAGHLTPEQAAAHPDRHTLTRYLGGVVKADTLYVGRRSYRADDTFLLCTDGLSTLVTETRIREILSLPLSPQDRARKLIEAALEENGGADNITVEVVAFKPGQDDDPLPPVPIYGRRARARAFIGGLALGLLLGGFLTWLWLG